MGRTIYRFYCYRCIGNFLYVTDRLFRMTLQPVSNRGNGKEDPYETTAAFGPVR